MLALSLELEDRLARLAISCVNREYPNKISHVLASDADARPPRALTPAFYGCYDWHSAVHNHWLLARLARRFPGAAFVSAAEEALRRNLSAKNIAVEAAYLAGEGRESFERPYGLAWLLHLVQELNEWPDFPGPELVANLQPLEQAAVARLRPWLARLPYPVRTGEHNQTAFALGLMIDYALHKQQADFGKHASFLNLLTSSARRFYLADRNWPIEYEPSGEDFLSPGLAEADLMRRVLRGADFAAWLTGFAPHGFDGLRPVVSPDPSDPKFSHLDGLNLSRAWMLEGIAQALAQTDPRRQVLQQSSEAHAQAGLKALSGEHYVGSHWLGTFAVYLLTGRGAGKRSG
jgi:hypothetical protein